MDRTSYEHLARFDLPDLDEASRPLRRSPIGVICVLKWAAAAGVLFFAACAVLQLGYCMAAERTLSQATRAGVIEAMLPRATRESIIQTIERRLVGHPISISALQITIQQNDAPLQRVFRLADDDHISVALSVPANSVLPAWLRAVNSWTGDSRIEARAEQRMPSRQLRMTSRN
jgi:hypothetical protein